MPDAPTFILERTFNAPRPLVWRSWTEKELLARWYGPGVECVIHELEVKPGGVWRNEMRMGSGSFRERFDYLEVEAPQKLVWLQTSVEDDWTTRTKPQMENWPSVLRGEVTLAQTGDSTDLRLSWTPFDASKAESAAFAAAMDGLGRGWGSGMDIIAEILEELQA